MSREGELRGTPGGMREEVAGHRASTSRLLYGQPCPYLCCQRDESRNWLASQIMEADKVAEIR